MNYTDYDYIAPHLFVGAYPPPGEAPQSVDVLVFCARELQPAPGDYPDQIVLRCPLDDEERMTREELARVKRTAKTIAQHCAAKMRVLVTCRSGVNRAAFVAGWTLHYLTGASGKKCIKTVQAYRHPDCGDAVLNNRTFTRALADLPASVRAVLF